MRFNTALAAMMEFVNGAYKWEVRPREALRPFILLLAPYAPHLGEPGGRLPVGWHGQLPTVGLAGASPPPTLMHANTQTPHCPLLLLVQLRRCGCSWAAAPATAAAAAAAVAA